MRCLKFENQGNPVNQRELHRGRKRIFGKSTEVAQSHTGVNNHYNHGFRNTFDYNHYVYSDYLVGSVPAIAHIIRY